eukprot:8202602-Alexandrium_andersonii.AAC.1
MQSQELDSKSARDRPWANTNPRQATTNTLMLGMRVLGKQCGNAGRPSKVRVPRLGVGDDGGDGTR